MNLHRIADHQPETVLSLTMNSQLAAAMNAWRLAQTPPLDINEAIYALLWRGLTAEGPPVSAAAPVAASGDAQTQELIRGFREFLATAPVKPRV